MIKELLEALEKLNQKVSTKEILYAQQRGLADDYEQAKTRIAGDVAAELDDKGKPVFSNADKRKAEVDRRLAETETAALFHRADQQYKLACAGYEQALETVKTLRAALNYETSRNHLEAARLEASSAATYAELQAQEMNRHMQQLTSLTVNGPTRPTSTTARIQQPSTAIPKITPTSAPNQPKRTIQQAAENAAEYDKEDLPF